MKIHLAWIRVTATAAIVAGAGALPAAAQYAPYQSIPQQPSAQPAAQPAPTQPAYPNPWQRALQKLGAAPLGAPAVAPNPQTAAVSYQPTPAYPQTGAVPYRPAQTYQQPASAYPQTAPQYQTPYPGYPAVARQPSESLPAPQGGEAELTPPAVNGGPMNGGPMNGATNGQVMPNGHVMPHGDAGYPGGYQQDCNCSNGHATTGYGNGGHADYGVKGYFDNPGHDTQWFGGVYYLFMNRDNPDFRRFAAQVDTPAGGYPYYPTSDLTALSLPHVDHDYRSGVEVRFGSTLGGWGGDDCDDYGYGYGNNCDNCEPCSPPQFAWEVGYWFLDDDENTAEVIDSIPNDTNRVYGMKNFAGLQYNGEPVNLWYDYQVPVQDPANPPPWGTGTLVRVLAQRVRTNFQTQNLELNFLHLPLCGAGCESHGGGHCDECETGDCEPACGSPFSVTTLCGFRWMRIDDDFQYASMWAIDDGTGTLTPPAYTPWDGVGELYYDINVDNQLAGFQLGANMNYCVSCKCNVFCNSNFGFYNNHIESYQRVYGELGPATWVGSGEDATVNSDKDDVAFVGEMLVGGSYDFTCHCRGMVAYRAVALGGVALSVDQMPEDFSNEAEVALIDSDGSLIIHGLQVGTEWRY